MWQFADGTEFEILNLMPGNIYFNYGFTVISIFAILGIGIALILKIATRA